MTKEDDRKENKLLLIAIVATILLVSSLILLAYVFTVYTDKHPYFSYVLYLCYGLGTSLLCLFFLSKIGRMVVYALLIGGLLAAIREILKIYLNEVHIPSWPFAVIGCGIVAWIAGWVAYTSYRNRGQVKLGLDKSSENDE